ncbi:MAG: phosphoadenosine phosphosulfate reductase family protein, partial [Mariprofundaceae bacterium]|nr:phosphoadenosine phosphosulfate reductase family protein [Mariprofundaceae bacterium]
MEKVIQTVAWLEQAAAEYAPDLVFACSFGAEDVLMLDLIAKHDIAIRIITLDTGRLPQETYHVMDACRARYNLNMEIYLPDAQD